MLFIGRKLKHVYVTYSFHEHLIFFWLTLVVDIFSLKFVFSIHQRNIIQKVVFLPSTPNTPSTPGTPELPVSPVPLVRPEPPVSLVPFVPPIYPVPPGHSKRSWIKIYFILTPLSSKKIILWKIAFKSLIKVLCQTLLIFSKMTLQ